MTVAERYLNPQRRLAEYATILGDIRLAVAMWDGLRKDTIHGSVRIFYQSHIVELIHGYRKFYPFFLPLHPRVRYTSQASLSALNARESAATSNYCLLDMQFAGISV